MLAILYNAGDHAAPNAIGTIVFPMGDLTLVKNAGGEFSIVFTDETGGCPVEVQFSDELLFHLNTLRDDVHENAVMLVKEKPGPPLPEGWESPF